MKRRAFLKKLSILTGCAVIGISAIAGAVVGAAHAEEFKVAIVLPGVVTDKSFNQAGYEGVKKASEDLGFPMAHSEKVPQPDQPEALSDYARRGYNVVIGHGGEFQESVNRVARRHKDTMFIVVNGTEPKDNVATMVFDMKSMGYVIGYTGGKLSKSGIGGFVGAQKIKAYVELGEGFDAGFKAARPDGTAKSAWTNDWDDIAKGKEAALNLISQGADVIFPTMDNGVIGSLQAVKEKGQKGFGIYYDAVVDWPDTVVQSAVLDMRGALGTILETAKNGKLEGKAYKYGFETPRAFRLGSFHDSVPAEVQADVESVVAKIKSGEMTP
ncbi:BMP family protein [Pelagibius sp. Alg239-R121]|uniref:BMP family protein n=1 Tax=Pelagibius sp. Alg239-R121 TaxID=2993448 RepID=UPI0024A6EB2F|nr:BMP family protein [Pelagibius sp. Alg239-R121]